MSAFAKFAIKSVVRRVSLTPTEARRQKLVSAINEQLEVAEAAARGEQYAVTVPRWTQNESGERVRVQRQKVVRSWFFERDGGCYIQIKYGSKVLLLSKDGNALFVKQLSEVKAALEAVRNAATSGELDSAIDAAIKPRKAM
jgi:hypothetical protein